MRKRCVKTLVAIGIIFVQLNAIACSLPKDRLGSENYPPESWKTVETDVFSIALPKSVSGGKVPGIDTRLWEYRNDALTLKIEFGLESAVPDTVLDQRNYKIERLTIDGRRADVITFDGPSKDERSNQANESKSMIIFLRDIKDSDENLKLWFSYDATSSSEVQHIVRSIRVK